jgi:hypothetical protein
MTAEKGKRAAYTLASYKLEAVRLVQGGQACANLGLVGEKYFSAPSGSYR